MPLVPVTFDSFAGGIADQYIGTDIHRAELMINWLIDETKKPVVRYGTTIFPNKVGGAFKPSGLYIGPEPFSHPVVVSGPSALVAAETALWTEIVGPNTSFLPTKDNTLESGIVWRRQIVACAPKIGLPPAMIYGTSYVAPSNPATPATYRALTLGIPALASSPTTGFLFTVTAANATAGATYTNNTQTFTVLHTIAAGTSLYVTGTGAPLASGTLTKSAGTGDATITFSAVVTNNNDPTAANQYVYAFFYKQTFVDYTGTVFAFLGNPAIPGFVQGSTSADPSTAPINILGIPTLANTIYTNYDVSSQATTNTTFTANSMTATVASATGIALGAQLINANVVQGTVVTAINGTTITLSQAARSSASASSTIFATLTVQIYRTINGGSVLFYDGMVPNGTATYVDSVSDANLQLQQPIYTSGGALGYDQPPTNAVALTQTNDFFWFATTKTLYQSIQGAPGACPSSFSNDVDQKIIGLSDVVSFPILFCDQSVYRVEGTFDSFGNAGYSLREISKKAGCVSNTSIVKTPYGLIWFGNGGIYATDGYAVTKLTKHLNISYSVWANSVVQGEYDSAKNMVYWTINTTSNPLGSNNAWLVLHLAYGLQEESVFTTLQSENNLYPTTLRFSSAIDVANSDPSISTTATWTSPSSTITVSSATGIRVGQTVTGVGIPFGTTVLSIVGTAVTLSKATNQSGSVTAVVFSQIIYSQLYSRMMFTDTNGYLLWFDPASLTDVLINTNLYPTQMAKKTIFYDFTTAGLDQGVQGFRKYTADVVLEVDAQTPVAIQIRHRRDDGGGGWSGEGGTPPTGRGTAGSPGGGSTGNPGVPEIRQDGAISWNITDCAWLNDSIEHLWNDFATVSGKRSVPAAQLRSSRRQLKFCNSYTVIAGSDQYGTCTIVKQVGSNLPTVTLDTVGQIWITDPEGYWITFVVDGYNQSYYILNRVSDTVLQLTDPYATLVNGSSKWEIKGYRKFERPRLLSFTMNAEVDGPTYGQATAPTGANV